DNQTHLFDLDGTIYLGGELLPGAERTIATLTGTGAAVRYVTNNPTRLPADYAAKLTGLGIPTHPDEVITSVTATTMWLRENHPEAAVYPIGEPPLLEALREAGVRLSSEPAEIDFVLASFDRTFTTKSSRSLSMRCGSTSGRPSSPPTPTSSAPTRGAAANPMRPRSSRRSRPPRGCA